MFEVDDFGNITLTQGDSGKLTVTGLPTDKDYKVYLGIQDENRKPVGSEIVVQSNMSDTVVFAIMAALTDLLNVPKDEDYAIYPYGIKICYEPEGLEETLIIGEIATNTITAYPKKVEGTLNG